MLALAALSSACDATAEAPRNLLLLTLDTTRADFLSTYGSELGETPSLDGLAREGTRFDLAIATAAVTPVSHASILTGLNNAQHGLRVISAEAGYRLPASVPTLATLLQAAGYGTAAVHSSFTVSAHFGLERGFEVFQSFEGGLDPLADDHDWSVQRLQRRADETTDLALDYLRGATEPFLLWIHYWDPHDQARLPPPEYLPPPGASQPDRRLYAAEVRFMDAEIGRVLRFLRERGCHDRTIVVAVADHGEGLGDHGWSRHRVLYQEQIRVPLILRLPGERVVRRVRDLVSTVDLLPTLLDYLGLESPPGLAGRTLRPLLEGRADPPRLALADPINGYDLNTRLAERQPANAFLYSVQNAGWKLIYRAAAPEASELYDLEADPKEQRNLYGQRSDQTQRLLAELAHARPWVTAPFGSPRGGDADGTARARAALEALGYLAGASSGEGDPSWIWVCVEDAAAGRRDPGPSCRAPSIPVIAEAVSRAGP